MTILETLVLYKQIINISGQSNLTLHSKRVDSQVSKVTTKEVQPSDTAGVSKHQCWCSSLRQTKDQFNHLCIKLLDYM